mmetsp:Transcript_7897/g.19359  ORF Transcript_7897/g.19359 Transcript_7897/m.19359 type:complete len:313 (+) Transcript_7897:1974-2912(+)
MLHLAVADVHRQDRTGDRLPLEQFEGPSDLPLHHQVGLHQKVQELRGLAHPRERPRQRVELAHPPLLRHVRGGRGVHAGRAAASVRAAEVAPVAALRAGRGVRESPLPVLPTPRVPDHHRPGGLGERAPEPREHVHEPRPKPTPGVWPPRLGEVEDGASGSSALFTWADRFAELAAEEARAELPHRTAQVDAAAVAAGEVEVEAVEVDQEGGVVLALAELRSGLGLPLGVLRGDRVRGANFFKGRQASSSIGFLRGESGEDWRPPPNSPPPLWWWATPVRLTRNLALAVLGSGRHVCFDLHSAFVGVAFWGP